MPSIGARLFRTTAICVGGLTIVACQSVQPAAVATLDDAVHTKALIEAASNRAARTQQQFAEGAEAARRAGDLSAAITLAEQAIALDTNDEGARRTLAASYFAAGRLTSAADAYVDLLAMNPAAGSHKFGAALTALAKGDKARAHLMLRELASDPERAGDVGLAYVLLGDIPRGLSMLEGAVRSGASTSRTRQNLALAQALSGDWNLARVTAAIDLPPAEVDQRVAEWAAMSVSDDTAWRTAMLLDLNPVADDAGRPVQLAWVPPVTDAPVQVADVQPAPPVETPSAEIESSVETVSVVNVPESFPAAPEDTAEQAEPVASAVLPLRSARVVNASTLSVAPRSPDFTPDVKSVPEEPKKQEKPEKTSLAPELPKAGEGGSWLVQLGSYDRLQWVKDNWQVLKAENDFLSEYRPVRSKTEVEGRTYYRLSVGRFDTRTDAVSLCEALQAEGGRCFVREGKFKG